MYWFYANFLPWAIASRSTFIHHFQPSACFAFMALAFLLFKASNKNKFENRGFVLSILVLIIISTIYWLPLQLGIPISSESFIHACGSNHGYRDRQADSENCLCAAYL